MLSLASRIELGLAVKLECWRLICSRYGFSGNAPWNSRRAEAPTVAPRVAGLLALRWAEALPSRRVEAPTAATILQRAELVALMVAQTAAASEREKANWRRAPTSSPVLAALLTARLAEFLMDLAAEVLAGHFPECSCELRAPRLGLTRTADVASGS